MAKAEGQKGGQAIRDLGYRPYVGERLPAKHNSAVLLRHGLRRAWGSWLVKIAAFLCWLPPVIAMGGVGINYWMRSQQPGMVESVEAGWDLSVVYEWQIWLFVTMVTLGAGASVIAEDFQHKSFQFYFAKPVTRVQYLAGRISAVAIWVFCLLAIPGALLVLILVGSAEPDDRVANLGTILPAMIQPRPDHDRLDAPLPRPARARGHRRGGRRLGVAPPHLDPGAARRDERHPLQASG